MSNIVGIRFERAGKISYFSCGDLQLTFGDHVIVESSWGLDFGTVVTPAAGRGRGGKGKNAATLRCASGYSGRRAQF